MVTAGTYFFGSARYRAGSLGHVRIRVALASEFALGRGPTSGLLAQWASVRLQGALDVDSSEP